MLESCNDKMQLGAASKAEGYCYGELDSDRATSLSRRAGGVKILLDMRLRCI